MYLHYIDYSSQGSNTQNININSLDYNNRYSQMNKSYVC